MSYMENVERYRMQLWRNIQRQGDNYPHRGTPARMNHLYKLMDYARRAGIDYNEAFNTSFREDQLLIGFAGKRLKDKMRERKYAFQGRKVSKIRRTIFRNALQCMSLRDRVTFNRIVPVTAIEEITLFDIKEIVFIRNRKRGEIRVRDGQLVEHVYPWVIDETKTNADVIAAWSPITVSEIRVTGERKVRPLIPVGNLMRQRSNGTE